VLESRVTPKEALSGPSLPCVGPAPATWYVSICVRVRVRAACGDRRTNYNREAAKVGIGVSRAPS
jgi:hypothetical protein